MLECTGIYSLHDIMPSLKRQRDSQKKTTKKSAKKEKEKVIKEDDEEDSLACPNCKKTFSSDIGLEYHIGKYLLCVCLLKWRFAMSRAMNWIHPSFNTHIKISSDHILYQYISEKKVCQKEDIEYKCSHCDKVFTTEKRLANHVGKYPPLIRWQ